MDARTDLRLQAGLGDSGRSAGPDRSGVQRGPSALGWIPALIGLVLFSAVALRGLAPARAESRRLERAEIERLAMRARLSSEVEFWTLLLEAQRDPVYLERERRARR